MGFPRLAILCIALLVNAGCGLLPPQSGGGDWDDPDRIRVSTLADDGSKPVADEVFDILSGEIAAQRGEFDAAYVYYMNAARLGDAYAAQKATRIALHLKDNQRTREALEAWLRLAPQDVGARQVATLFYATQGDVDQADIHLRELFSLLSDQGDTKYILIAAVGSAVKDVRVQTELMNRLTSAYPNRPEVHYISALVAAGANQYKTATAAAKKAISLRPDWVNARVLLSKILLNQGDPAGARRVLEEGLALAKNDNELRSAYARLLVDTEDLESAYQQFSRVLQGDPENPEVEYALGLLGFQLGRLDEAARHFDKLFNMNRHRDEAAFFLGEIAEQQKKPEIAERWYHRARGPFQLDAQVRLAKLMAGRGDIQPSRDVLQRLRVQAPTQALTLYLVEGEILREVNHLDLAMQVYADALEVFPKNAKLLYARALTAAEIKRVDILEADLREVLRQDPEHADALNALGYTLADLTDRYEEALGYIRRALELKPGNAAILDSMGWVLYRLGRNEEALGYLEQAYDLFPDAEIAAHLGEVLWVQGERKQARRVWQQGLEKSPDNKYLRTLMKKYR